MDPARFDSMTRIFAARRSRRSAIGSAAAGAAVLGLGRVSAHDATPEASPVGSDRAGVPFMFVQTFGPGTIAPATDGVQNILLVADHVAGQTLYFSDRPERIVGMVPTEEFLAGGEEGTGIGFAPDDPPNAALVLGDGRMLVVELFDPQYDVASGQVRYQMRALEDITQVDLQLESEPLTVADMAGDFTAASLFIDDCPDGQVVCWNVDGRVGTIPGGGNMGFCWDADDVCCLPCEAPPVGGSWDESCNAAFPSDCGNGGCTHSYSAAFSCAND